MRITAPNSNAHAANTSASRRTSSTGFSLPDSEAAKPQSPIVNLRTIGGIDTLVALQGLEDPGERRRRAVRKGRTALDALDTLKTDLLGGHIDPSALNRLKAVAAQIKEPTGNSGLDTVLAEIELRLEVEIAKMSPR